MSTAVEKLLNMVTKYGTVTMSDVWTNQDGEKYQYRHIRGPKNTPVYLRKAFQAAATEATGKYYETGFYLSEFGSFHFDRNPFKGGIDGRISVSQLVLL